MCLFLHMFAGGYLNYYRRYIKYGMIWIENHFPLKGTMPIFSTQNFIPDFMFEMDKA